MSIVGKRVASALGIAITVILSFVDWQPVFGAFPILEMMPEVVIAFPLAVIAFVINKRPMKFFGIRPVGRRDLGPAFLAFFAVFAVVAMAQPIVNYLERSSPSTPGGDPLREAPLWLALLLAVSAGVCEEFIYRGFLIEELGPLVRSRALAAIVAVVCFVVAHHNSRGWSFELIYPGLIGAVITGLYLWRRNLPICMLLHAILDSLYALTR
jgi:membrane protease YdiL (CAAX protease family)